MLNVPAREKALKEGVVALENAELLALVVGSGRNDRTREGQMGTLLHRHGDSLRALGMHSAEELSQHEGLDRSKALALQASLELGRRLLEEERGKKVQIKGTGDIYEYFRIRMTDRPQEECHVMVLDTKNQVLATHLVSLGGLTQTSVDVRVVMRYALLHSGTQIVLVHNHPSGNPAPSREDEALTQTVAKACQALRIRLMDHVIIGDNTYYSFYEHDKI